MFRRIVLLSIVCCFSALPLAARADDNAPVTQADLKKLLDKMDKVVERIDNLEQHLPPAKAPSPPAAPILPAPGEPASPSNAAAKSAEVTESHNAELAAQVARLEQRIKVLENAADNQENLNVQLAEWVNGHKYNGQGAMAAIGVKPSVAPPTSGTLHIHNDMLTPQDVVINGGALHRVEPHSTLVVPVPVGSITTQIRGEGAMTWHIGAPNYSQDIIIAPAVRNPLNTVVIQ
jgi:hypothetical protein